MGPRRGAGDEPRLETGATLTLDLPMRGHVQVRVARDHRHRDDLRDRRRPPARGRGGLPLRGRARAGPPLRGRDLRPPGHAADALAMFPSASSSSAGTGPRSSRGQPRQAAPSPPSRSRPPSRPSRVKRSERPSRRSGSASTPSPGTRRRPSRWRRRCAWRPLPGRSSRPSQLKR